HYHDLYFPVLASLLFLSPDSPTTQLYTLSLHDALPISSALRDLGIKREERVLLAMQDCTDWPAAFLGAIYAGIVPVAVNTLLTRSEEHTSELQSHLNLVCRLLLEKKNNKKHVHLSSEST